MAYATSKRVIPKKMQRTLPLHVCFDKDMNSGLGEIFLCIFNLLGLIVGLGSFDSLGIQGMRMYMDLS